MKQLISYNYIKKFIITLRKINNETINLLLLYEKLFAKIQQFNKIN